MSAHGFSASVTVGHWHLLMQLRNQRLPSLGRVAALHVSLHDLSKDLLCGTNLRDQEPARAEEMLELLVAWLHEKDHGPLVAMRNTSAAEIAELSALGYSTGVESVKSEKPWVPVSLDREKNPGAATVSTQYAALSPGTIIITGILLGLSACGGDPIGIARWPRLCGTPDSRILRWPREPSCDHGSRVHSRQR